MTHDAPQPGADPGPEQGAPQPAVPPNAAGAPAEPTASAAAEPAGPRPGSTSEQPAPEQPAPAWGSPAAGGPGQGAPGPAAPGTPGPVPPSGGSSSFFDRIRQSTFTRSDDRWVGGVAAGFAERFRLDPLLVRGILVLSFFLTGAGLVVYALAWALLPERRDGRIHLQEALRGSFDVAMLGAVALFLIGVAWGGPWSWWDGTGWGWLGHLFWLAAIGLALYVLVQRLGRRTPPPPQGPLPTSGPVRFTGPPAGAPQGPVPPASPFPAPAQPADRYDAGHRDAYLPALPAPYLPAPQLPAPVAPAPSAPPKPPKGDRAGVGIAFGLILLVGALLLLQDRVADRFVAPFDTDLPFWPTWLGVSIVILGLALVVSGLRGRSGGAFTGWAIVALCVGVPWVLWGTEDGSGRVDWRSDARIVTDGTTVVGDLEAAEQGFNISFGDPTIDLSRLDLSGVDAGDPAVVPIQMGAGDATIVVPEDAAVEASVRVGAGTLRWEVDGQNREVSGVGQHTVLSSDEVTDDGPVLSLRVQLGAGDVRIIEENS